MVDGVKCKALCATKDHEMGSFFFCRLPLTPIHFHFARKTHNSTESEREKKKTRSDNNNRVKL